MKAYSFILFFTLFPFVVFATPTNDECDNAIVVSPDFLCNDVTDSLTGATASTSVPANTFLDVWFQFKPNNSKQYINVSGFGNFKASVQLYSGSCAGLTAVGAAQTSSDSTLSAFYTGLDTTITYYYRVYHNLSNTLPNNKVFSTCVLAPPINDECDSAIEVFPGLTCNSVFSDGTYATQSIVAGSNKGNANDDVWFKFKADTTFQFISITASPEYDPVVQVFKNCPATTATDFYNNDSYIKGSFGTDTVAGLIKGQTYYYRVYDFLAANPSTMSFTTCVLNPVKNDRCENANVVAPGVTCNPISGDGTYATQSLAGCAGTANDDIWYKFKAQSSVHFITVNASLVYNPVVQVFKNCSTALPAPNAFCDDNTFPKGGIGTAKVSGLIADSTYYYRVFDKENTNPNTMTFTTCVTSPPVNDDCAGATAVLPGYTCSPVVGNATYANQSVAQTCGGTANDDVWFKFIAQSTSQFISVTPDDADYEPIVQVYSSCTTATGSVFCDVSYTKGAFGTKLVSGLTKGNTYYYRVYDKNSVNQDTMTFSTCVVNPMANDECAGAINVTPGVTCSPTPGDGTYATESLNGCKGTANDDVWFKFKALNKTQFISVTPHDSKYNPVVQVFSDCATPFPDANASCEDASYLEGKFGNDSITGLTIGNTYYYRVYDENSTNRDTMTFNTCVVHKVENDACEGAINVVPGDVCLPVTGDGTYATQSLPGCDGTANDDVWFKFTAANSKQFISVDAPTGYNPVVQVFSSCGTPLNPAFCNDAAYLDGSFGTASLSGLAVGTTYLYRVYDKNTANTYPMAFSTCVVNPVKNDSCGQAIEVFPAAACNPIDGDGTYASQSIAQSCGGNANDDVWFKFTASNANSFIYVNSSADYNPVVQVYSNCAVAPTSVKCDDDRFPKYGTGSISVPTTVGSTYYYRVYDKGNTTPSPMTFTTCVTDPPLPPANDEPCGATLIKPAFTCDYITYTNEAATISPGIIAPGCAGTQYGDVWFKVKVPFSGELNFNTAQEGITDGGMAIYKGSSCANLTQKISCDDNSNGNMPEISEKGLIPGDTIWVRIWEKGNDNNGTFKLCVTKPEEAVLVGPCTNLDFENDLSGWFGTTGSVKDGAASDPSPIYAPAVFKTTSPASRFEIMTGGIDPVGGFPRVFQGNKSIRLGEGNSGNKGQSIEQYFPVTKSNTNFIYNYAAVLQSGGHPANQQPFFRAELFDDDGKQISCGDYLVAAPKTGLGDGIGFLKSPNPSLNDVIYKPWTKVSIDLTPHIGKNVHVRFTTGSCSQTAHYGYVYLDCACAPFEVITPGSICLGDTAVLYAPEGAQSYEWKDASGAVVSNLDSLVVKPTLSGPNPYTCEVTMFGTSLCNSSLTTKVEVGATPTIIIHDPIPVCKPATVDITLPAVTDSSTPNLTYSYWKDIAASQALLNQGAIDTSGTYYIKGERSATCMDIKPVKVAINHNPTLKVNNPSICGGDSAIVIASPDSVGSYLYKWSYPTGFSNPGDTSGFATTITGTYSVTIKDKITSCESEIASGSVKINALPTVSINSPKICLGDTAIITATPGITGNYSYAWVVPAGFANPGDTSSFKTTVAGIYKLVLTDDSISCSSDTASGTLIINQKPTLTVDSASFCIGDSARITATPGLASVYKYSWTVPAGFANPGDSSSFITKIAGIYSAIIIDTATSCKSDSAHGKVIVISAVDSVSITADKNPICIGDTITFIATPLDGGKDPSFQWKINGNSVGSDSTVFVSSTILNGDKISVVMTSDVTCLPPPASPISSNIISVTVNPKPKISLTVNDISCNGLSDGSVIVGANGGSKFSSDGVIFQDNNLFKDLSAGKYTFTVKDANGCKSTIDSVISSPPPITFMVDPVSALICVGDSVSIKAIGYNSFNWFDLKTGTKIDSNKTTIKVSPTSTRMYKVVSSLCGVADSVSINVLDPILIDPIADKTICLGQTATFKAHATGGKGSFKYTWTPVPDFMSANGDSGAVTPIITNPITYSLKAENDCKGYFIGFKLIINPLPIIKINSINEICEGEKVEFVNADHLPEYVNYSWNFNDGDTSADTAKTSHTYTTAGNYMTSLVIIDKNKCEQTGKSDNILVNPVPKAIIYNSPSDELNTNSLIFFSADRSIGNIKRYEWTFGSAFNAFSADTTVNFPDSGTYKVKLIVFNDNCADTAYKTIEVISDYGLFVPSAFTPDNDQVNDYFMPKAFGILDYTMQIFNQWGELMFETKDLSQGWDGKKFGGSLIEPEGVYVYKINFNPIIKKDEKPIQKIGHLTLIK